MLVFFYKFIKQLCNNRIIFNFNSNKYLIVKSHPLKQILIFFLFISSNRIYSQNFDDDNINIFEKNIETGFEMPINIWNINTIEDDFAPCFVYSTNEFYYNSIVNGYSKYFVVEPKLTKGSTANAYQNVLFLQPKQLNSPLNQSSKNRAYFTIIPNDVNHKRCAFVNASTQHATGNYVNIQKTIFERNTWNQPTPVAEFSGENFIGYPTVSPTGDLMVFVSNKNSTDRTTDLWIALQNSEQNWDMLVPIDELNSVGNEITPHFASDSLLLFASDGFDGNGGYDLYYSVYSGGKWSKPTPLENINTEFDETDPAVLMNKYLVFASSRPGGKGNLDLYIAAPQLLDADKKIVYNFSLAATNYALNINKTSAYDLISNEAKLQFNNDTTGNFTDTNFVMSPQHIEFTIESDSSISKLQLHYTVECNQTVLNTGNVNFDNETSATWIINFIKWSNIIFQSDTITLNIYHQQELLKSLPIEIIKTETKEIKKHNKNGQNHYRVITAIAGNIDDYLNINNDIINSLAELTSHSKSIEISISKSSNYDKMLKEIQNYLKISDKSKLVSTPTDSKLIIFRIVI